MISASPPLSGPGAEGRPAIASAASATDPAAGAATGPAALAESVAAHALVWLIAACAVGLWLALLLLAPGLGAVAAPFTYGRWAALHLDLALYGWLSLPLIGLLFLSYGIDRRPRRGRAALALWSGALLTGALSWLVGRTSGKLFLDWRGAAGWLFLLAQLGLAAVLASGFVEELTERRRRRPDGGALRETTRASTGSRVLGLVALLLVPAALALGASRATYPAINPASGGPTGASLLGSTLALVAVVLLIPRLLRLPEIAAPGRRNRAPAPLTLALHGAFFLLLGSADAANQEPLQQLAVASTALWAWLLPADLARFLWPAGSRAWLRALFAWGALVVATGVGQFLPAPLAQLKFTHFLVAHAHAAMAGFGSALAVLLLHVPLARTANAALFRAPLPFWLWQGGAVAHVAALGGLGALEATDPAALLSGGAAVDALFGVRLLAGGAMLAAALVWFGSVAARGVTAGGSA